MPDPSTAAIAAGDRVQILEPLSGGRARVRTDLAAGFGRQLLARDAWRAARIAGARDARA